MGELKRALSEKVNWKARKRSVSMLKKYQPQRKTHRTVNVNISEGAVSVKGSTRSLNPKADAKSKPKADAKSKPPDDAKSNPFTFQ
jgi:hypothetical protein